MKKIVRLLRSPKGETVTESIVSLMIFALLMLAVATMVAVSLRMTDGATVSADARQGEANTLILGGGIIDAGEFTLTEINAAGQPVADGLALTVEVEVARSEEETYTAFTVVP